MYEEQKDRSGSRDGRSRGMIRSTRALALTTALVPFAPSALSSALEEVIVTAQKKAENLQDVPIAVNALDARTLNDLNVSNFEDYVRYQPNLTTAGNGPGQSAFFIRGMATNLLDIGLSEIAGTSPTVALYLDEQPVSTISRNLDVYVTDIERIEVLAGPQGTLYGASSQAGTVRIITRKPVLDETQAGVEISYSDTAHGETGNSVEGYFNLPVIEDRLALRFAGYNATRGGYIDNKPALLTLPADNAGIVNGGFLSRLQDPDVEFVSVSNSALVEDDFNDVNYQGIRVSALYKFNEDWTLNVKHMRQKLETEGVFTDDPEGSGGVLTDDLDGEGEYAVARFYPDELEDEFSQTSWTIEGRLGALDLLYTGSYLERDVEQTFDYAGYISAGLFVAYYICDYYAPADRTPVCYDPTYGSNMDVRFTRNTHEFRLSTPEENRLSLIAGLFYDDSESENDIRFIQPGLLTLVETTPPFYAANGEVPVLEPIPGSTTFNPGPREAGTTFFNDATRTEEQYAVFGELTFDLTDQLAITGGFRYYNIEVGLGGSTVFVFGGLNIDDALEGESPETQDDIIYKLNLSWRPNENQLYYLTYSEGFRPGGFNRNGGAGTPPRLVPFSYESDSVENYEIGWKISAWDDRLRFNGAAYWVDWSDMQLSIQDGSVSNLAFIDNVGESEVKGLEGDLSLAATDNLTLFASFSYNDTELTEVPPGVVNLAPEGSQLAFTPEYQFNVRGRYEWDLASGLAAHVQVALQYADESYNSIEVAKRLEIDSWTAVDVTAGIARDRWRLTLFAENATDERIVRSKIASDPRNLANVARPRTIGLRLSYDF